MAVCHVVYCVPSSQGGMVGLELEPCTVFMYSMVHVPVMHLDFRQMYPVISLLKLSGFSTDTHFTGK